MQCRKTQDQKIIYPVFIIYLTLSLQIGVETTPGTLMLKSFKDILSCYTLDTTLWHSMKDIALDILHVYMISTRRHISRLEFTVYKTYTAIGQTV